VFVLGLLPLLALPLAVVACRTRTDDHAAALLTGLAVWGVTAAAGVQLLSLGHAFTRGPMLLIWGGFDLIALAVVVRTRPELPRLPRGLSRTAVVVVALLMTVLMVELVIDVRSPPNNWDSMTYHMGRVAHWIQDRGVGYYPTGIDRQLWNGPLNEWVIAQVQVLAGSDLLANLIQWMNGLMVALLSWWLALELGLSRRAAGWAVVGAVTTPPLVLQATNTETDLAVAMWLLAFILAASRDARNPSLRGGLLVGVLLGMTCLTKGSGFIFACPWLVLWVYRRLRYSFGIASRDVAVAGLVAVAIVTPMFARNYAQWHDVLGPPATVGITNATQHTPATAWSTLVRSAATQLTTPSGKLNHVTFVAAKSLVQASGQDVSNPAVTFRGNTFGVAFVRDEDYAAAPLHLLLILAGLVAVGLAVRRRARLAWHAAAWLGGVMLYVLLIRWSIWNNRIEIPLLVAGMPFAALILARLPRAATIPVAGLLVLSALAWLTIDDARPLVSTGGHPGIFTQSREALYFEKRSDLQAPVRGIIAELNARHAQTVGVIEGRDDWEYPFFALSPEHGKRRTFFDARTADWKRPDRMPKPDAIVCMDPTAGECIPLPGWQVHPYGGLRLIVPA
jgi:hypothetical protein